MVGRRVDLPSRSRNWCFTWNNPLGSVPVEDDQDSVEPSSEGTEVGSWASSVRSEFSVVQDPVRRRLDAARVHHLSVLDAVHAEMERHLSRECVSYYVYQFEVSHSGTFHVQGYLQLKAAKGLGGVTRILPGANLSMRLRSHEAARRYCTPEKKKDAETIVEGTCRERGNPRADQGKRNDLEEVGDRVRPICIDVPRLPYSLQEGGRDNPIVVG